MLAMNTLLSMRMQIDGDVSTVQNVQVRRIINYVNLILFTFWTDRKYHTFQVKALLQSQTKQPDVPM